jgi:hypothetical protein
MRKLLCGVAIVAAFLFGILFHNASLNGSVQARATCGDIPSLWTTSEFAARAGLGYDGVNKEHADQLMAMFATGKIKTYDPNMITEDARRKISHTLATWVKCKANETGAL